MARPSLQRAGNPLANPLVQLQILETGRTDSAESSCRGTTAHEANIPAFSQTLNTHGCAPLVADEVRVLQVNVGKLCNQTCRHCHVDAGPDRREIMTQQTMREILAALDRSMIETVDVTGGAPEMVPEFEWFVRELTSRKLHVVDRCNLTILTAPGFTHLPEFLADHGVEVVASLPCYLESNCDSQRGDGVFQKSITGLRRLNELGYGMPGSPLTLSLVYNPVGVSLPGEQGQLEAAYRKELRSRFGIEFHRLYTITNMPISRFLDDLLNEGEYESYMQRLLDAFNPQATQQVMCRSTLSVDWQGYLYDCDFNQMLDLRVVAEGAQHIRDFTAASMAGRRVVTGRHCYGCTAGSGSSCQGALLT